MPTDRAKRARRSILGRCADWVVPFDPGDYENNPQAIALLHQAKQLALASSLDLEDQVRDLETRVHQLTLQNQRLELELTEASRKSFVVFSLSLLGTVMVGIGASIVPAASGGWIGWVMIIVGCLIEGITFFLRPRKGK